MPREGKLTCWKGKCGELCEEVARPVPFVLLEGQRRLLPHACCQVHIGLGGKTLTCLGWCGGEEETQHFRTLKPVGKKMGVRKTENVATSDTKKLLRDKEQQTETRL